MNVGIALLQGAHIGNEVHPHDFRGEERSGVMISTFPPACGNDFRSLQGGVIAGIVEDYDIRARLRLLPR